MHPIKYLFLLQCSGIRYSSKINFAINSFTVHRNNSSVRVFKMVVTKRAAIKKLKKDVNRVRLANF